MRNGQTRYTYPVVGGRPITLELGLSQEHYLSAYWGGIQFNAAMACSLGIYKQTQKAQSRFDVTGYDWETNVWKPTVASKQPDYNRVQRMRGWEQCFSADPNDILVAADGNSLSYLWTPSVPPGLYKEAWTFHGMGGREYGPIEMYTRIYSRAYAPTGDPRATMHFSLEVWPENVPAYNAGFAITAGVVPVLEGPVNPFNIAHMRSVLSSAWVDIVEGWRVEDEYGEKLNPWEYVRIESPAGSGVPVRLDRQLFNWFYGTIDTRLLTPGVYKLRFRLNFQAGPPVPGTLDLTNVQPYYDDYWKTLRVTVLQASELPAMPLVPYDCVTNASPGVALGCNVLNLDRIHGRFVPTYYRETFSVDAPPLSEDYMSKKPLAVDANELPLRFSDAEFTSHTSFVTIGSPMDPGFIPIVATDLTMRAPSNPISGGGVANYYKVVGDQIVIDSEDPTMPNTWRVWYATPSRATAGHITMETWDVADTLHYDGKRYMPLQRVPNGTLLWVWTRNGGPRMRDDTPVLLIDPDDENLAPVFEGYPAALEIKDYSSQGAWIMVYYSYDARAGEVVTQTIKTFAIQTTSKDIVLSSDMIKTFTPLVVTGGRPLFPGTEYTLTYNGSQGTLHLVNTPTAPVYVWYN